jgi:protein TonB
MSSQVPLNKFFNIDWQDWKKPMVYALLASLVLHAILLAFKWHAESEQERRLKTPLSVVLVNASSPTAPINPKRLAQVNLNGGGELTEGQASALRLFFLNHLTIARSRAILKE